MSFEETTIHDSCHYYTPHFSQVTVHSTTSSSLFDSQRKFGLRNGVYHNGRAVQLFEPELYGKDNNEKGFLKTISRSIVNKSKQVWNSVVGTKDNTVYYTFGDNTLLEDNSNNHRSDISEQFFIPNKRRRILNTNYPTNSSRESKLNRNSPSVGSNRYVDFNRNSVSSSSSSMLLPTDETTLRTLTLSTKPSTKNWNIGKISRIGTEQSSSSSSTPQYGTSFYKRRRFRENNTHNSNNETILRDRSDQVKYLKMMFNGKYEIPKILKDEREHQLQLLEEDKKKNRENRNSLKELTIKIKNAISDKSFFDISNNNDDLILLKEQKLTPLDNRRKQYELQRLRFQRDLSLLEKSFKNYKQMVDDRERINEEYRLKQKLGKEEKLVPILSIKELNEVENALRRKDNGAVSNKNKFEVRVHDIKTLAPKRWLNDTVIEYFMQHIERSTSKTVAFNSFFYSSLSERGYQGVRRWMKRKKTSIDKLDRIFFPINLNQSHWALCMVDLVKKRINYIDSLSNGPNAMSFAILSDIQNYVIEESKQTIGEDFEFNHIKCPQQPNGFDCGIYVCMNTLYLSKNAQLNFDSDDAARMRQYIVHLIISP